MPHNMLCEVGKRWGYVVGFLVLFAYGFLTQLFSGYFNWSEVWFLQVVHRVASGEVLYRDVFFSSMPLSVYVSVLFALLFGSELLVGKALMALCFALTGLLSYRIARQLGLDRSEAMLVVGMLLVWRPKEGFSYTPLVYLFLLAALSAILLWWYDIQVKNGSLKSTSVIGLLIAGVCAGLAFATKQSVGTYTLAAVCFSIVVGYYRTGADKRRLLEACTLVFSAWFFTVSIVLLPVWLTGGVPRLIDYGVLGMQSYARASVIPYQDQLELLMRLITEPKPWGHAAPILWQLAFLLPFPTFVLLGWLWLRSELDKRKLISILLLFAGAAFAGVFPRVDIGHMIPAVPIFALGLVWACYQVIGECQERRQQVVRDAFLLGFAVFIVLGVIAHIIWLLPRAGAARREPCTLPHFRSVMMYPDSIEEVRAQAERLKQYTGGQPAFISSPSAAFYYLLMEMKNPTPYDFPLAGAFGRHGEAEIIEAIQQGRIRYVCMSPLGGDELAPVELERYVLEHMELMCDVGFCTLYRSQH